MNGWWAWLDHDLSRRRARLVALALFVAVASGAAVATIAGVRRSDSVVDRALGAIRPATAVIVPNEPGFDWSAVAALPEVAELVPFPVLYFELVGYEGEEFGGFPPASPGALETMERPVVLKGRVADQRRPDEVTVSPEIHARGIDVGDRLTIKLPSMADALAGAPDFRDRRRVDVTVVGVTKLSFFAWQVQPTYAFFEAHRDLIADGGYVNAIVRLRRDAADLPILDRHLNDLAGRPIEVLDNSETTRQMRQAVELETGALAVLALAAFGVVAVLVGQALGRLVTANPDELALLRQLGASSRTTTIAAVGAPAVGVLGGVVLAPAVAWLLSARFPIGVGREIEPRPGRELDLVAAAFGTLGLAVVLGTVLAVAGARSVPGRHGVAISDVRPPSRLARLPFPVPVTIGSQLALGRQPQRSEARSVTFAVATGVAGVVAAVTFNAGLRDAATDARMFGQVFDVATMVTDDGTVDPAVYDTVGADGVARLRNVVATIDGMAVSTVSLQPIAGDVHLPARRGRAPDGPDEIALGPEMFAVLGVAIGDEVALDGGIRARVVGETFLPEVGHTSYTSGAVVAPAVTERLIAAGLPVKFDVVALDLPDGADVAATVDRLAEPVRSQTMEWPPVARQTALARTHVLAVWFAAAVIVLTVGAVAHGLAATERRRRHEVAVLQVLGLSRPQARLTVVCHAVIATVVGVAVGVPVGFAIGRTTWEAVAALLPAFYRLPAAWAAIAAVVPIAFAGAMVLAGWPARRTANTEAAIALRVE